MARQPFAAQTLGNPATARRSGGIGVPGDADFRAARRSRRSPDLVPDACVPFERSVRWAARGRRPALRGEARGGGGRERAGGRRLRARSRRPILL